MIIHEKTPIDFNKASNRTIFFCICDYCGKEFTRSKRVILQCNQVVKKDSCGIGQCKKQKSEEVNMIRYGVKNAGSLPEKLERKERTNQERYGEKSYQNSSVCKEKNLKKYGVEHHLQAEEVKEKAKKTMEKNFGVDHHTKSEEYQNKRRSRQKERLGVTHHSKTKEFKEKIRKTYLERFGKEIFFHTDYFQNSVKKCGITEAEIKEFLPNGFNPDRKVLEGKEIDLFNGEIGIEYCGLYWHHEFSPQPRTRSYHYEKYKKCMDKGIRLITIFEDEWKLRKSQCKNMLNSILGINDRKVFARKCIVKEIEKETFIDFCEKHHIQGGCRSIIRFGIFYQEELLGVISLGKHHRGEGIVLNRLCFKSGVTVSGGASKLFSRCVRVCEGKEIISWSDNRWSSGNVYEKLGFVLDKELPPDYSYVLIKGGSLERLSKQSCKKKNKDCPEGKTEREWMAELGYARIWDCGKKRWVFS